MMGSARGTGIKTSHGCLPLPSCSGVVMYYLIGQVASHPIVKRGSS